MPLLSRKKDLTYLIFFLIHIPVMFCTLSLPTHPHFTHPNNSQASISILSIPLTSALPH